MTTTTPAPARGDGRTEAQALALLREHLRERRGPAAADLPLQTLSGDASTRRYFRLIEPATATTLVLALYPEPFEPERMPFLETRRLLDGYALPVPRIEDVDAQRGILVLQDLGDLTLQEVLRDTDDARRRVLYEEACEQLAILQRESVRGPRTASCFTVAFDLEKLSWELHYFLKHFVEALRGADLTAEDRAVLAESTHRFCDEIASWPRVLCHRDFHSRNLMEHGGRLHWIDFQDARLGPATYDLASLLRDSYVDLDEGLVAERAEAFRRQACPDEPRDVFERRFELMSVQRNLKALGTFGFMATQRGNEVYLPYIPLTLRHARRNLVRHAELRDLHRVLSRHIEELQ